VQQRIQTSQQLQQLDSYSQAAILALVNQQASNESGHDISYVTSIGKLLRCLNGQVKVAEFTPGSQKKVCGFLPAQRCFVWVGLFLRSPNTLLRHNRSYLTQLYGFRRTTMCRIQRDSEMMRTFGGMAKR
jgi:hypothetical protein